MSWLVDNANAFYLLLGFIAAGLVAIWWLNKRSKFLGYAAGVLVLIALVWLLTRFYISDTRQLELNVHALAQAVKDGKVDDLFKHVSKDFRFKEMDRDALYRMARAVIQSNKVNDIKITAFSVEELSRDKKFAKTRFRVSAWAEGSEAPRMFVTQADFVLEGDQWRLKTMRFYNPLVDQDKEIDIPGLR
jgi:hypothetical protein